MNLITGGELFSEVERLGRMSEPYARFFFQQLIRGLDYCHSRGVFHRDLKPENLLLDNDKTLKITDFGLSTLLAMPGKALVEEKLLRTQCGTPHYVAPEILTMPPEGYLGAKTDVWSCGVILYVLVGGGLPFDDNEAVGPDDLNVIFKKIIRCDIQYPPHFSEELVNLLEHIFKENPRDRYSLKDIARHSWFLGPITTTEIGEEYSAGRQNDADIWQKNVQEILAVYDQYKPTGSERNLFCNVQAVEHAVEITQGEDGFPLVRAPKKSGAPDRGVSTDSLSLGLVRDSREAGLRYLDSDSWASSNPVSVPSRGDHASRRERDSVAQDKDLRFRDGKPIPEQLTRVLSEAMRSKFGSHGSHSSDEDHGSDLENALEIGGGYTDDDGDGKAYEKADAAEMLETRKAIRRVRSADDLPASSSWVSESTAKKDETNYSANDAGLAERFRIDLWNMVGAKFREETEKPHISANGKAFELEESIADADGRGQLVRSMSYGGPFIPQTFKRSRPRSQRAWAASSKSNVRGDSPVPVRRPPRLVAVRAPSPLATAPVVYAQRPEERKSMGRDGTGHEWKPYEHQDNLLWCKMMRDYDMIPDYEEFGVESNELNNVWREELARENFLPMKSIPRHGSTTFVMARSSVELSSQAWREKSRKWRSMDATPMTLFGAQPKESFHSQMSKAGTDTLEADADFLTHEDMPADALRKFVERRGLISDHDLELSGTDYDKKQLRLYRNTLLSRSGAGSRDRSVPDFVGPSGNEEDVNLDEDAIVPRTDSGSANMRTAELLSTPPGVAPGLIHTSSTQTVLSSLRYPDMPSRHSRDGDPLPYDLSRRSTSSSVEVPVYKSPRRIASGPLRQGYGSEAGHSSSSNKSSVNGNEQAELNAQNLFQIKIPGPQIRPPLPESRPFSRVLKPTTRVAKRFLAPRIPSLALRRASHFHSLVEVTRCQEIITEILEKNGCEIRQEKKKGDRLRLRVSLKSNAVVLTAIVEVYAVDSTLTAVTFERKSGDQSAFLEFFSKIRQFHSEYVMAENAERNESGASGKEKNASQSPPSSRT